MNKNTLIENIIALDNSRTAEALAELKNAELKQILAELKSEAEATETLAELVEAEQLAEAEAEQLAETFEIASADELFSRAFNIVERVIDVCDKLAYIYGTAKNPTKFEQYCAEYVFDKKITIDSVEYDSYQRCLLLRDADGKIFDMWVHATKRNDAMHIEYVDFCFAQRLYEAVELAEAIQQKHKQKLRYIDCTETLLKLTTAEALETLTATAETLFNLYYVDAEAEQTADAEQTTEQLF